MQRAGFSVLHSIQLCERLAIRTLTRAMTFSGLPSSRSRDEAIRRDAMRWREDEESRQASARPIRRTRRPLRSQRDKKETPVWDEYGCLTNAFEEKYYSRTDVSKDTNSITLRRTQGLTQKVKPKRRAASVSKASQMRAIERLSAMRKAPVEKKEKRQVETDFEGFMERQNESQKARMNASKQKKFAKPSMCDGTKSIIKKARIRSQLMQFPPQPEVNNTPERPSKPLSQTSGRLANMDPALELNLKEVKLAVLRDEMMRERPEEYGSARASGRRSSRSPRAWHPKMTHKTADERREIEEKALKLRPIVSQTEKERWVKPEYGKKPDYIEVILDTLGIDEETRRKQRNQKKRF